MFRQLADDLILSIHRRMATLFTHAASLGPPVLSAYRGPLETDDRLREPKDWCGSLFGRRLPVRFCAARH